MASKEVIQNKTMRICFSRLLITNISAIFLVTVSLTACASTSQGNFSKESSIELTDAAHILSQMSTEEKVAQLFVVSPERLVHGVSKGAYTQVDNKLVEAAARYPVAGFILFGRNIQSAEQVRAFNKSLSKLTPIPPILAIDEEGGWVARLALNRNLFLPRFANMETVGKTGNTENARGAGQIIGSYLATFGFTLDFAPVVDVNTNPENIVIGDRAFGDNPKLVSDMAAAFLSGLHSTGVKGCIKHFPGHGDTKGDTHKDYVAVTKTWDELKSCEIIPFRQNLGNTDCVMVAHVTCPAIDSLYPASLSKTLITDKLRGELGYKGLILTDALHMGAIVKSYGAGEACVLAFEAGNDILLMPKDFHAGYDAILKAVQSGRISEERLNESVLRILQFKGY